MKRFDKVMWGLGALLVLSMIGMAIGGAKMLGYEPFREVSHPLVGHDAPAMGLPLVAGAHVGDRVSLEALRGEVVLLDFWASFCAPCRRSIPRLNMVHERYGDRIRMYGVNLDGGMSPAQIQAAHEDFGASFPSLSDDQGAAQTAFEVQSIPTLVLIDQNGVIRWIERGVPELDDVIDQIDALL